jgi:5-methylcytosine-specific restriction endonuclease McrA
MKTREQKAAYNAVWRAEHRAEIAAYRAEHRAEIAAKEAAYNAEHRAEAAAYRAEHRAEIAAYNAAYGAEHREQKAAYAAVWRAEHPERALTGYAIRRGAIIVEIVDPRVLFERDAGICHICSRPVDPDRWDTDHVIPLSAGGEHSYANTAVSHPSCNQSKGSRTPNRAGKAA